MRPRRRRRPSAFRHCRDLPSATGERRYVAPPRAVVLGLSLDLLDAHDLVARVFGDLEHGRGGWILTPNVDILRQCVKQPHLSALAEQATLKIMDGAPLEWACRLSTGPASRRIPGSSMPWLFAPVAARTGRRLIMIGGRPGAAETAAASLRHAAPGLEVSHHFPEYGFEEDADEWSALRLALEHSGADIAFVGLGFPKQERVIQELRVDFPGVWFVGCGAAIDFVAGVVPRAPGWMQRVGLEWAHRVLMEPRRLARRYLVDDIPFAIRLLTSAVRHRSAVVGSAVSISESRGQ